MNFKKAKILSLLTVILVSLNFILLWERMSSLKTFPKPQTDQVDVVTRTVLIQVNIKHFQFYLWKYSICFSYININASPCWHNYALGQNDQKFLIVLKIKLLEKVNMMNFKET